MEGVDTTAKWRTHSQVATDVDGLGPGAVAQWFRQFAACHPDRR